MKDLGWRDPIWFWRGVEGDLLDWGDGRYIVCDPIYIGASVGMAMPEYKKQDVQVYVEVVPTG